MSEIPTLDASSLVGCIIVCIGESSMWWKMFRRRRTVIIHLEWVQLISKQNMILSALNHPKEEDLFPGFLKHHDDDHVSDAPMVTRKSRFCVVWGTHVEELVYQVVYPSELIRLQNPSIPGFPVVRNHEREPPHAVEMMADDADNPAPAIPVLSLFCDASNQILQVQENHRMLQHGCAIAKWF